MPRHWFEPPVSVRSEKPGVTIIISSVERAAEQLLTWSDRGSKWRAAAAACMAALNGTGTPSEARAAFVEAAKDHGVWLDG